MESERIARTPAPPCPSGAIGRRARIRPWRICARPDTAGGRRSMPSNPCPQLRRFTGQVNRRSPTRTAACIRPALLVPDERRLRESNPQVTACTSVANPVGFNRRRRPFRTLGRTPAPLPDRPVPTRRVNRRVGTVARHTDVHEAREGEPRIPYGRHSGTRRGVGAFRSGIGMAPRRGFEPRTSGSKGRCATGCTSGE